MRLPATLEQNQFYRMVSEVLDKQNTATVVEKSCDEAIYRLKNEVSRAQSQSQSKKTLSALKTAKEAKKRKADQIK